MTKRTIAPSDVLEIDDVPLNRRAEVLERAFRDLSPGDVFWVAGFGDVNHYERFLHARFTGEVNWVDDFDLN
ncbi:MAG TPA: hypothetical protein VKT80_13380, partial [Chloroflexota bacterium]|nr:hypothetical protein [Chloroflexota bacterium]